MDSGWLETLPTQDPFAAQDGVVQWLRTFAGKIATTPNRAHFDALQKTDRHCAANSQKLVTRYLETPTLSFEEDDRLWEAVHAYHYYFARAWLSFVSASVEQSDKFELQDELPTIVGQSLHHLANTGKWHYFRYKPVPAGYWHRMHGLFALAERSGFADRCTATYLRALMLDTLGRASLHKQEIEQVDLWLQEWVRNIPLEATFEEEWQLFYVDLSADVGGRRIRNFEPTPNCRYWDTDYIVRLLERARIALQQGEVPEEMELTRPSNVMNYPTLLHHLLAEWSRGDVYKRQRRSEDRDSVKKRAQAIHGIFGVCQHVKNVMFARHGGDIPTEAELADEAERWVIENESPHGFGATVDPELETWLKVGRLVALDYEMNKDITVVGVVRNISQQPNGRSYVGIQALSHMPTYVLLRGADAANSGAPPVFDGMPPFPGIYLPREEGKHATASLIIPAIEYITAGVFELRMENHPYLVNMGDIVEQKDDWVRVEVKEIKISQKPHVSNNPDLMMN